MKKTVLALVLLSAIVTGCHRETDNDVWRDDGQLSANYKGSARTLWGAEENEAFFESKEEDFVALKDEDLRPLFTDGAIPQPKWEPGEHGSGIPGIDGFHSPIGAESAIFKNVYFNTDDHILRGTEYSTMIDRMSAYLKSHPHTYLFVSGHCDERGPEAYNLSLGARRANYVRTLLVQKGIDPERIHTISYGKERPAEMGHGPEAWSRNRRAEFKIFQQR
ncbi:MAG: OmpA family protein [Verrucomicrobia bacterium]|nr:OmpA family protein [Verrucomicrobiota bacterium]